jgi:CHAT domain-containing protein
MKPDQEDMIRRYLLGKASPEEQWQVEERAFSDDDYAEWMYVIEDELIEDYVRGGIVGKDKDLFEKNLLCTPDVRSKVALVRALEGYASKYTTEAAVSAPANSMMRSILHWLGPSGRPIFAYAAACAVMILGLGLWRILLGPSGVERGLIALNQAYFKERPVEARVTGFGYARYTITRGADTVRIDSLKRKLADNILHEQAVKEKNSKSFHALGKLYLTDKNFSEAVKYFELALKDDGSNAKLHNDLAVALMEREKTKRLNESTGEDYAKAVEHLHRALDLDDALHEAHFNLALCHQYQKLWRHAKENWKKYLERDSQSQWAEEAKRHLQIIDEVLIKVSVSRDQVFRDFLAAYRQGDNVHALHIFSQSYVFNGNDIVERLLDNYLNAKVQGREGEAKEQMRVLFYIGELNRAKTGDRFTSNLARFYSHASPSQLVRLIDARQLMKEGYHAHLKSENDRAIEIYEQAKNLFTRAGNRGEVLMVDILVGRSQYQRGYIDKSLQIFTRLENVCVEREYYWMRSQAFYGLATAHRMAGFFSQAVDEALKGGELSEQVDDQGGVARSIYLRGDLYHYLGKPHEALRLSRQGIDLSGNVQYLSGNVQYYLIAFYQSSSLSLSSLGLFEGAQSYQQEVVKMASERGIPHQLSRSYAHLGAIYGQLKEYDKAIANIQHGIDIGRQLGKEETGRELTHYGLLQLGHIYREAGRFDESLQIFDQVIDFYRRTGGEVNLYSASKGRLLTLMAQGDDLATQKALESVITLYEKYRERIGEESNRNSFFGREQGIYDLAINFAYQKLKDPKQALAFSEASRARSLFDVSHRGWRMIAGPETPELRISENAVPIGPSEIQRRIPDSAQLVVYAVLDDKVLIWVISKTNIESQIAKISLADLTVRVNQYLRLVSYPSAQDDQGWQASAADLYDILVRPIGPILDKQKQICFIPDKILTLLPFGALISRESGRFLLEEYAVFYAPSANMFLRSTEQAQQKASIKHERVLAIGNPRFDRDTFPTLPDLPAATREASIIASYYESPVLLTGSQAKEDVVRREMLHADVLHLSTHYVADSVSPMLSKILLSPGQGSGQDGVLRLSDIYQLRTLRARLAVLSACQTGVESYFGGEGAIGSSRPFIAGGVPLIVASLWPIDTQATSDLMIAFHRSRKQLGQSTVEALKTAQLDMQRKGNRYQHPYYWASFIAVGGYSEY